MNTTPRLWAVHWVEPASGQRCCAVAPLGTEGEAWVWLWQQRPYVDPKSIRVELYRPSLRSQLS